MRPMWIGSASSEGASSSVVVGGRLKVPWSSRRARPAGVWSKGGRALAFLLLLLLLLADCEDVRGCRVAVVAGWAMAMMKLSAFAVRCAVVYDKVFDTMRVPWTASFLLEKVPSDSIR